MQLLLEAQKEDILEKENFETTLNDFIGTCRKEGYTDEQIKKELEMEM